MLYKFVCGIVSVFFLVLFISNHQRITKVFADYQTEVDTTITVGTVTTGNGTDPTPNSNNCNGKWTAALAKLQNVTPPKRPEINFGDPTCDFNQNIVSTKIDQADLAQSDPHAAKHLKCWVTVIIPWESSFSPLAFNPGSTSGLGAYGLFQMNPAWAGRANGDVGDVYWLTQIKNAIKHNAGDGYRFIYWDPNTLVHDVNGYCTP